MTELKRWGASFSQTQDTRKDENAMKNPFPFHSLSRSNCMITAEGRRLRQRYTPRRRLSDRQTDLPGSIKRTGLILWTTAVLSLTGCSIDAGMTGYTGEPGSAVSGADTEAAGTVAADTQVKAAAQDSEEHFAETVGSDPEESLKEVCYLGPAGTYTEEAARLFFDEAATLLPMDTVADAIAEVSSGGSDYAVIPQENTLGGAVTDYVDALIAGEDIFVVGEVILPIDQTLMGVPGATIGDIKTVCSHAQGIKQTTVWRSEHMPDAVTEEMKSTAAAAAYVAQQGDKAIAAIAAPGAADLYGLSVLAESIQISDANRTRFYVLSQTPLPEDAHSRAAFVAECEANRIDDILVTIRDTGLELVTVHDRPEGSALGKYRYIIEAEDEDGITEEQMDRICGDAAVRFLGTFNLVEKPVSGGDVSAVPGDAATAADTADNAPASPSDDREQEPATVRSREATSYGSGIRPDTVRYKHAFIEEESAGAARASLSREGYALKQVVCLSRHNIRAPLSGAGSSLDTITPHKWFDWSAEASQLSVRGGTLETEMGQYFRKWLEAEGLFAPNYQPEDEAVRIYANSKQRTIATAQFFAAGLLPVHNIDIEYHAEFDTMDPVFNPVFTSLSDAWARAAEEEIHDHYDSVIAGLDDNYALLEDVIDVEESEDYINGSFTGFTTDDSVFSLEEGEEPSVAGSLKKACSISDALVLQYYEEPDRKKAAFGHALSDGDWEAISEIKDVYGDVLFSAPSVAVNVAHPLLEEIRNELSEEGREFTFLCGHDSNLASVLASLEVCEYSLPDTIEKKTPIGVKLVISRWEAPAGEDRITLDLVYQKTDQLRELTLPDAGNPPGIYSLRLEGLDADENGMYPAEDVIGRFTGAIEAYDEMISRW